MEEANSPNWPYKAPTMSREEFLQVLWSETKWFHQWCDSAEPPPKTKHYCKRSPCTCAAPLPKKPEVPNEPGCTCSPIDRPEGCPCSDGVKSMLKLDADARAYAQSLPQKYANTQPAADERPGWKKPEVPRIKECPPYAHPVSECAFLNPPPPAAPTHMITELADWPPTTRAGDPERISFPKPTAYPSPYTGPFVPFSIDWEGAAAACRRLPPAAIATFPDPEGKPELHVYTTVGSGAGTTYHKASPGSAVHEVVVQADPYGRAANPHPHSRRYPTVVQHGLSGMFEGILQGMKPGFTSFQNGLWDLDMHWGDPR